MSTLGQRLRRARLELGLTQEAIAKPDLQKKFISMIERDLARPSIQILEQLAQRLGQPIAYFLEDHHAVASNESLDNLYGVGRSQHIYGDYNTALETLAEVSALAASQGNSEMVMRAALGKGEALLQLRRLEEAYANLEEALTRGREARDRIIECRALHGLATIELRRGHAPNAANLYRKALSVVSKLNDVEPTLHGEIWLYLSTALFRMGRLEQAWVACVQAQDVLENSVQPNRLGEVHLNLGVILYKSGDYDGALHQYERARALLEQSGNSRVLSHVLNNVGMVLIEMGRCDEAIVHLSASLAIKKQLHDSAGECRTLTELARCFVDCGDIQKAREYAGQAVSLSGGAGAPDEGARAQIILGMIALKEGDFRKAERYLLLAAAQCVRMCMTPELVAVYRELARIATLQGRHKEASEYQERAFSELPTAGPRDIIGTLHIVDLVSGQDTESGKALRPAP